MNSPRALLSGVALFVAGFLSGNFEIAVGTAQETYPTEHKGIGITELGIVSEESMTRQTGLEGYFLQLRIATLEPGGQVARRCGRIDSGNGLRIHAG